MASTWKDVPLSHPYRLLAAFVGAPAAELIGLFRGTSTLACVLTPVPNCPARVAHFTTTNGHYCLQKRFAASMVPGRLDVTRTAADRVAMRHGVMRIALEEAASASARGEVPVGAVIVELASGQILSRAGNRVEELADPTAHAEILAIRAATAALRSPRLFGCELWVTLEPCAMCAQAIAFARVHRLCFAAYDAKGGGVEHGARIFQQPTCHHRPEVIGGIHEEAAASTSAPVFRRATLSRGRPPMRQWPAITACKGLVSSNSRCCSALAST